MSFEAFHYCWYFSWFFIFFMSSKIDFPLYFWPHIWLSRSQITNTLYNNQQVQYVKSRIRFLHIISILNSQFLNASLYKVMNLQEKVDLTHNTHTHAANLHNLHTQLSLTSIRQHTPHTHNCNNNTQQPYISILDDTYLVIHNTWMYTTPHTTNNIFEYINNQNITSFKTRSPNYFALPMYNLMKSIIWDSRHSHFWTYVTLDLKIISLIVIASNQNHIPCFSILRLITFFNYSYKVCVSEWYRFAMITIGIQIVD